MDQKVFLEPEATRLFAMIRIYSYLTRVHINGSPYHVFFDLEITQNPRHGYGHVCLILDFDEVGRIACNESGGLSDRKTLNRLWEKLREYEYDELRCFLGPDKKLRYWLSVQDVLQILPHDCVRIAPADTMGFGHIKIDWDAIDWGDTSQTGPCKQCLPHIERIMNVVFMHCLEVNKEHRKFREGLA